MSATDPLPEQNPEEPVVHPTGRHRAAAALLGLEGAGVLGYAGWVLVAGLGDSDDVGRVVAESVTLAVIAALGLLMALGLARGNSFARTPSLLWHLMILLSGLWIAQVGQPLLGGLLGLAGLGGLVLTARLPHADL